MAELDAQNKPKKSRALLKLTILLILLFSGFVGFRYWKLKAVERTKNQPQNSALTNIESEIFDLSENKETQEESNFDESHFKDLTLTQLKEGGAEFVYQLLLRNQIQIAELKTQNQNLKNEFAKYKAEQKSGRIIFVYIDLRQRFFEGDTYKEVLHSFESLAVLDKELQKKLLILKPLLEKFPGNENLRKNFNHLIPDLIAAKHYPTNDGLLSKMRHNLSKLVIIRKLDANEQSVDGTIRRIEIALQNDNFQAAYEALQTLDASYHDLISNYLEELNNAMQLQKIDDEILLYLRGSINN